MSFEIQSAVPAKYCMIWMHGLGATYHDMVGLVQELAISQLPMNHLFLQAPTQKVTINQSMEMPAWYDIKHMSLLEREDKNSIERSEQLVLNAIQSVEDKGFSPAHIFLAGFSQGGAMSLFTGLRYQQPLAGLVCLSGYLPLAQELKAQQHKQTPIFMASGEHDPIVNPQWAQLSHQKMASWGYGQVKLTSYPMMHEVCRQEMADLRQWIERCVVSK